MNELPKEFWTQPGEALGDENLQLIYAEVCERLRAESGEADTLELMLIERIAFLYVHIRNKERDDSFANDRAYKETLQLWTGMAADLRKQRIASADFEAVKVQMLESIQTAILSASESLPPEYSKAFREQVLEEFQHIGL